MTQLGSYRPTVPLDAEGCVCASTPCLSCGYDLRTQPAEGVCPECAYPVRLSIGGQLLRYAAPHWVRRMSRGVLLLIIAAAAAVGGGILLQMVTLLTLALAAPSAPPTSSFIMLPALGQFLLAAAVLVLVIVGLWFVTTRDPSGPYRPESFTARRILRVCTWLLPVPLVLGLLMVPYWVSIMPVTPPASPFTMFTPTFVVLAVLNAVSSLVIFVVTPLALLRHLMALMRRIPRPGLVRFAQIEFWGGLSAGTLLLVAYGWLLLHFLIPMMTAPPTMVPVPVAGPGVTTTLPAVPVTNYSPGPGTTVTYQYGYTYTVTSGQVSTSGTAPPATTMPTTMMAVPAMPPMGIGFLAGAITSSVGGCATLGFVIAGFILLILVQRALSGAAREAAQNAAEAQPVVAQPLKD
jgi:hypothetical protein